MVGAGYLEYHHRLFINSMISARNIMRGLRTLFLRSEKGLGSPGNVIHRARSLSSGNIDENIIKLSDEVKQAMLEQKPLVALESTIITHGMPFPQNLKTALDVENIIREQGATPATIAILKGEIHIGLSEEQLTKLSDIQSGDTTVKTSRRDLPYVLAMGLNGGTTVSGTIFAAGIVGIPVFVTGGIGGVHRLGQDTFDISADLTELGRSSICVVSSGVKSILDIGRTLEYLETQGVCVATFGDTKDFPSFYTRRSGYLSPYNVCNAEQAARLVKASRDIQLDSGILVAVPVPEEFAMDEQLINSAIDKALSDADSEGIRGKQVTPFVLAAVAKVTVGKSLETNMALIRNNARVGGQIAVQYNKLSQATRQPPPSDNHCDSALPRSYNGFGTRKGDNVSGIRHFHTDSRLHTDSANRNRHLHTDRVSGSLNGNGIIPFKNMSPVVVGGSNVDRAFRVLEGDLKTGDGQQHLPEDTDTAMMITNPHAKRKYGDYGKTHQNGKNTAPSLW